MKSSKYNICLPYEDKYIIFNGVTKRFFLVSNQNKNAFLQILSAPDDSLGVYDSFLKQMTDEGFIIEDNIDELEIVRQRYQEYLNNNEYRLMILPTYSCNVACWYCIQRHQSLRLTEDDVERIKKHIEYYFSTYSLKGLHLSWFGGEPLLDFKHIDEIASYAQSYCKGHHLRYHSTITSNGILLSASILKRMKELNFTFFQITIDGAQKEHDKIKVMKGKSSYETVLKNICRITEILPSADIHLRFNYTHNNIKPKQFVRDLNRYLPISVRKHIQLSLMKVWQENILKINVEKLDELVSLANESGYLTTIGAGFYPCYVDMQHFNCVFPNGKIDKCDNIGPEKCRGTIDVKGNIKWNGVPSFNKFTIYDDNSAPCLSCNYLPICYGPCPYEREQAKNKNCSIKCRYKYPDKIYEKRILSYCQNIIRQQK